MLIGFSLHLIHVILSFNILHLRIDRSTQVPIETLSRRRFLISSSACFGFATTILVLYGEVRGECAIKFNQGAVHL